MATAHRRHSPISPSRVLDLRTNQIADYPDARLGDRPTRATSSDSSSAPNGKELYASVGPLTDPTGARQGDTGNGIAVYNFAGGKVCSRSVSSRSHRSRSRRGKKLAVGLKGTPPHMAIPYPAGLAVIADGGHDKLLIANNLSDNVVLLDPASGKILQTFDLSTSDLVPSSFPYTCVATHDGRRAWCSLWNASQVAELDLTSGKVVRWIKLKQPRRSAGAGFASHGDAAESR